jgi:hypothetical protein
MWYKRVTLAYDRIGSPRASFSPGEVAHVSMKPIALKPSRKIYDIHSPEFLLSA